MPNKNPIGHLLASIGLTLAVGLLSGCDQTGSKLDDVVATLPAAGTAAAAKELTAAFDAGTITFESALIRAEELLDAEDPVGPAFAGATLAFGEAIEDEFRSGPEFELFWRRIGQLAYRSAFSAMQSGDWMLGTELVEAGPARWQRESYWRAYPNHDVLVAVALGQGGRAGEGIRRLRSRITQTPEMTEAIRQLQPMAAAQARARREAEREALRERLRAGIEAERSMDEAGGG